VHEAVVEFANLDAYGVAGADERAAEAAAAYAAGTAAVAALESLPPGPQLATALTEVSGLALDQKARITLVGQWERQRSWTDAQAMAALGAAMGPPDLQTDRSVIADIGRVLHVSEQSVGTRVVTMRHVAAGLNDSWDALSAGVITPAHLWVLATVTRDATPRLCSEVERQVLAKAITRGWTPAQLADAARLALVKADPDGAEQRARDAKTSRSDVTLRSDEDMMAALIARTDAWTARQTMDEINRRADQMRRDDDSRPIGQLRIAALAAALLGAEHDDEPITDDEPDEPQLATPAPRTPKRATALLLITLPTLLGGDRPGWLDGYGPITASLARRIAASDIRFRRLLLDPETGRPRDLGDTSYQLSPAMRRWIDARDRTCRFPGCTRRATYCDADHAVEWPTGTTSCANCGLLCRRHHNLKTSKTWQLTRNNDDSVDWHSPHGFHWHVDPADYSEFLDLPDIELDTG
jgi:hypothetical protein